MRETERVAELVQTRQIDDAVTEENVCSGAPRNILPPRFHVGLYEGGRSRPSVDNQRPHLSVLAVRCVSPVESNERGRFGGGLESKRRGGTSLPRFQGPERKLSIGRTEAGPPAPVRDEVGNGTLRVKSPRPAGLRGGRSDRAKRNEQAGSDRDRRDCESVPAHSRWRNRQDATCGVETESRASSA